MQMKSLMIMTVILFTSVVSTLAQSDTTLTEVDPNSTTIRRKPNGEWLLGIQQASYAFDNGLSGSSKFTAEDSYTYFGVGYGGHIPLFEIGAYGTFWLVPAGNVWLNVGNTTTTDEYGNVFSETGVGFDVNVPIHATIGYGGLRRKSMAWGIEGGLGVNAAFRTRSDWNENVFTISPSAMVDLTYAPKNIFRLRFIVDLLPAELSDYETIRTWMLQLVVGI